MAAWIRIRIRIRIEIKGWIRIPIETSEDPRHCLKLTDRTVPLLNSRSVNEYQQSAERSAAVATQGQQAAEVFVQPELKAVFTVKETHSFLSFKSKNLKIKHLTILQPVQE